MSACDLPVVRSACGAAGGAGHAISSVAAAPFEAAAKEIADGFGKAFGIVLTFWTKVNLPGLSNDSGPVADLRNSLTWAAIFIAVMSTLWAAGKLALKRNSEPATAAFRGLMTLLIVGGALTALVGLLSGIGDSFSSWIIDRSTGGQLGGRIAAMTAAMTVLGPGLVFIVAIVGILAALFQIVLMIGRIAVVVMLTGSMQTLAAGTATDKGRESFEKAMAWLFAALLYKPVAAVVYATSFFLIGDGKDATSVLAGLMMIMLAIVALPALIKLLTPAASAAAQGIGGAHAARQASSDVASGAKHVKSVKSSSKSSSGGGSGGNGRGGGGGGAAPTGAAPTGGTAAKGAAGGNGVPALAGAGRAGAGAGGAAGGAGAGAAGAAGAAAGPAVAAVAAVGAVKKAAGAVADGAIGKDEGTSK